jgi:hypothetical protein
MCFFLSCKANARVKLAKTGHGPHSSTLVVICVISLLYVLFYVLFVCKCVLPPGDNPTEVNKYITSSTCLHFPVTSSRLVPHIFPKPYSGIPRDCVINHLNAKLNPICHLLSLLGAHHILLVSRIRVKVSHLYQAGHNHGFVYSRIRL